MGDIIVLGVIGIVVALVIWGMWKDHKKGKSCGCSGNCSGCSAGCNHKE
jgi:hypothetical protein